MLIRGVIGEKSGRADGGLGRRKKTLKISAFRGFDRYLVVTFGLLVLL